MPLRSILRNLGYLQDDPILQDERMSPKGEDLRGANTVCEPFGWDAHFFEVMSK